MEILIPVLIVSGIGLVAGVILAIASIVMAVPKDEKAEALLEVLPGANCGACGFSGCSGYAAALSYFDMRLPEIIGALAPDDVLMITADHGCDPSYTKTTDHTREYVPYLICGKGVKPGVDLGTKLCFGTIAQTICDYLGVDASTLDGKSVLGDILA